MRLIQTSILQNDHEDDTSSGCVRPCPRSSRREKALTFLEKQVSLLTSAATRTRIFFQTLVCCTFIILPPASFAETNVWMLAPGFSARELPVKLSNINSLRFTPDGRLAALGYDGRVHLLQDTDGDGLEDSDVLFWDKSTLSVPVGMAWSKDGLYVSSHGKVSLLRDTDRDGKADLEEIVATGWPPTDVGSGGVDATAVTLDREGNLYFGLLTADYSNPYRVKDGVSRYDTNGPRGTIQKWRASARRLETIATGIRVPYTLAFNRHGDLFVTDQEGETWCPGGNPLDELNHIMTGRNYGFPPRHEKYLPNLISEPPVVAFGPQHQSTCGLVFNETKPGQKVFGPSWWEGDAFVAGESRGKIWRVRLAKTPAGYIGQETLIARLSMLTTDMAISPKGDLYVSCHSGPPDWGTGPQGQGKIFKISYDDAKAPQPVAIWPSGPMEVSVVFDKPINAAALDRPEDIKIEFGEYVSAADRLEVLKPPYKAVQQQEATPRGTLRVVAARLSPGRRTLSLTTDPHPQSVRYALTLPGIKGDGTRLPPAVVDLAYDLTGVEASWVARGRNRSTNWNGWLPHLDWQVSSAFIARSAAHETLAGLIRRSGQLQLRTRVVLPGGGFKLRIEASAPFELTLAAKKIIARPAPARSYAAEITLNSAEPSELLAIKIETSASKALSLHTTYFTASDPTPRPLPLGSLLLPWAPLHQPAPSFASETMDLSGGDYELGRELFFGERLKCSACHQLRGQGATVGPDLSNLAHRDAASVLRDIKEPNAMIHPDYVAYNVRLREGGDLAGFVRTQTGDSLRVVGADGKEQIVRSAQVSELHPSKVSLMPSGLLDGIPESQVRDLMTFLVHEAPKPSPAEVQAVLRPQGGVADKAEQSMKPLHVVLVASKQDHGPGQHDYPAWQKKWMMLEAPGLTMAGAWEWPTLEQWRKADVMVFYFWNHNWSAERYQQLDDYQARGGGIVVFHSATIADVEPQKLAERIGLAAQPGPTKYLHTPLTLNFVAPTNHAITRGFKQLPLLDEPYWPMFGDTNRVEVLATADIDGAPRPLVWTFQKGPGRVFASIIGHYSWTFDDPLFHLLTLRGLAWAAGEPMGKFEILMKQ
jgi:putative heme-binding domain-containing protein